MKGCTTLEELMNMPNVYSHAIYKQYSEISKDEKKREAAEGEVMADELEDALGG